MPTPLARLRTLSSGLGLDGVVVPRTDPYQNEVTAPHDDCLRYLSGFTGSAGMAIVLADRALLFVDGRYSVQVRHEVDLAVWDIHPLHDAPPHVWLRANTQRGWRIGTDATRLSATAFDRLAFACSAAGAALVAMPDDPFDAIWPLRPEKPQGRIRMMPDSVAGESSATKRDRIAARLRTVGADMLVETLPDNIAWLLNVRGSDVPMNPVPQSFLLLDAEGGAEWFVDPRKLGNALDWPDIPGISRTDPDRFADRLAGAAAGKAVLIDPDFAPAAIRTHITNAGGRVIAQPDPITLAKALKNPTELAGYRACHVEDGTALTDFLAWLAVEVPRREAAGRSLTELDAEQKLHEIRSGRAGFLEDSFRTISAAGANAAMCHYAASAATDAPILSDRPYLIDSGGQYLNGTTDVTRTLMIGPPDDAMRDAYTAVLKGFLSLLTARFPTGTKGHQLDAFARRALWDIGRDYDHGTGHSVGHNLLIHEYPYRFAKQANDFGLEPGAVMTIEPGYYAEGAFGMRIENQVEVIADSHPGFCRFASLTLAPIDLAMARPERLTREEIMALDSYHAEVRDRLRSLVRPETIDFLIDRTRPLWEQIGAVHL